MLRLLRQNSISLGVLRIPTAGSVHSCDILRTRTRASDQNDRIRDSFNKSRISFTANVDVLWPG